MKRALVLALVAGCLFVVVGTSASAQAPTPVPTAPRPSGRVAVFNVAKVMRDYQKWQAFAKIMQDKRVAASGDLVKIRTRIAEKQQAMATEQSQIKKDEMMKEVVAMNRNLEDSERTMAKQLNDESAVYLKNLFTEIQTCVQAVVQANNFDLVMAYPDALTEEELTSPQYFDLKLRPNAAMPFYISPNADMTGVLIDTLNARYPAPAATAPAAAPAAAPAK